MVQPLPKDRPGSSVFQSWTGRPIGTVEVVGRRDRLIGSARFFERGKIETKSPQATGLTYDAAIEKARAFSDTVGNELLKGGGSKETSTPMMAVAQAKDGTYMVLGAFITREGWSGIGPREMETMRFSATEWDFSAPRPESPYSRDRKLKVESVRVVDTDPALAALVGSRTWIDLRNGQNATSAS